jgi:cobaltochelatase CobN
VKAALQEMFKGEVQLEYFFSLLRVPFAEDVKEAIEASLGRADIVFMAMVFDLSVADMLRKHCRANTVVVTSSISEIIRFTRLGKFSFASIMDAVADSRVLKALKVLKGLMSSSTKSRIEIRKLYTTIDTILKFLRFGKFKDAANYVLCWKYHHFGNRQNYLNMFLLLLAEYHGMKVFYNPPEEFPERGIYHPQAPRFYTSAEEYLKWYQRSYQSGKMSGKPLVGMLFYSSRLANENVNDIDALIKKLEEKGVGSIAAAVDTIGSVKAIKDLFLNREDQPIIECIVNIIFFRTDGGPLGGDYEAFINLCKKMDLPHIHLIEVNYKNHKEWDESAEGVTPIETTIAITLPELDGQIEGLVLSTNQDEGNGSDVVRTFEPVEDRVEKAASRIANWVKLRKKPNSEKKVAIVLFNYPPGKDNLGNVSYLDTFQSLIRLLDAMREDGFSVSGYPRTRHEFVRLITKKNTLNQSDWATLTKIKENAFKLSSSAYGEWFAQLAAEPRKRIISTWDNPPGTIMADEDNLYVPGLQFENVFIGFQPARGIHSDPTKSYHDSALPPHHQYMAFYRWLEDTFEADAILHFGTHGTLEFLPGKQVSLSGKCYPDIGIGNVPNIYLYTCSNPSEAMIAKRRSYATIVNHMTPPMIISDLYEKYAEIETEIHNYFDFKQTSPDRAKRIKKRILELAQGANLVDVEATEVNPDQLYDQIFEMKGALMPKGAHLLGKALEGEELVDYVLGIVRFDRGEVVSLQRSLAGGHGFDWDEMRKTPSKISKDGRLLGVVVEEVNQQARKALAMALLSGEPVKKCVKKLKKIKFDGNTRKNLEATLEFARTVAGYLGKNCEIEMLLKCLKGRYIPPGLAGDPIRSPNVIPTGRNAYQFDPNLIPTRLACERGESIVEQVLKGYQEANDGKLPETVGIILWGFETIKTQGETIAAIYHYLGLKPVRSGIGEVINLEPIPLEVLGRPRIDVAVEICGIFRDTLPETLKMIDKAFRIASALDESPEQNMVRKHALMIQKTLEKKGVSSKDAESLSRSRVFGPRESSYGTDLTQLIETSEWEEESELSDFHISKMSHIYGEGYHAHSSEDTFREVLDTVDVVSQVRTDDEYGITDLDHYYEFLGGLTKAVESVRKLKSAKRTPKPMVFVADSTKDKIKTSNLQTQLKHEARTRFLNPAWIKAQMDAGYTGVKKMNERVEYLLGWSVTAGQVDKWVWSEVAERYMFNEEARKKMMQENIWAVEGFLKRLMEAYNRGVWDASEEEIEKLKQIYLELESEIEEIEG